MRSEDKPVVSGGLLTRVCCVVSFVLSMVLPVTKSPKAAKSLQLTMNTAEDIFEAWSWALLVTSAVGAAFLSKLHAVPMSQCAGSSETS